MLRIKKKEGGSLTWRLLRVFFTDRITEGFKKVSFVRRRDGFTDEHVDKITEGFKTAALYGDETGSPMKHADGITKGFKMAAPYGDVFYLPSE
jgi:hypothetical protein